MGQDFRLTEHFTLAEFLHSQEAVRKGLGNIPSPDVVTVLTMVTAPGMERVRRVLANPINVNSGYRSPEVNAAVGGAKSSAHLSGLAVDFTCPMFGDPLLICRALTLAKADIGFDQLIQEGTWVHIAFPPKGRGPKLEVLTAHFAPGQKVTYTKGLA